MAAQWLCNTDISNKNIYIFSDSKGTLFKLEKGFTQSKLTLETVNLLNSMTTLNNIEILKVSAHMGIEGNERADALAKEGSKSLPIGPEPLASFTIGNILNDISHLLKNEQISKITNHLMLKFPTKLQF